MPVDGLDRPRPAAGEQRGPGRLAVGAPQLHDIDARSRAPCRAIPEGEIGAELDGHADEQLGGPLQAAGVAQQHGQVGVGQVRGAHARRGLGRHLDALRELHDPAVREVCEHALAEVLEERPPIAEIAAAVQQDRPVGMQLGQIGGAVPPDGRLIAHASAEAIQVRALAEVDEGIAGVVVQREVDEGHRAPGYEEPIQDGERLRLQAVLNRIGRRHGHPCRSMRRATAPAESSGALRIAHHESATR